MTIKKTSKILLTVIVVVLLGIGVSTFFKVNGSIGSDKIQLQLAHGQAGDSEIGGTITPPVGNVLFVAIFISLMPVTYIPALSEWLPTTLGLM